jgi:hypothetical protein
MLVRVGTTVGAAPLSVGCDGLALEVAIGGVDGWNDWAVDWVAVAEGNPFVLGALGDAEPELDPHPSSVLRQTRTSATCGAFSLTVLLREPLDASD